MGPLRGRLWLAYSGKEFWVTLNFVSLFSFWISFINSSQFYHGLGITASEGMVRCHWYFGKWRKSIRITMYLCAAGQALGAKRGRKHRKHRAQDAKLKETPGNIWPLPQTPETRKQAQRSLFTSQSLMKKFSSVVYIFWLEFPCQTPLLLSPQKKVGIFHAVSPLNYNILTGSQIKATNIETSTMVHWH